MKKKINSIPKQRKLPPKKTGIPKQIDIKPLADFQKKNNIFFNNESLLIQALTHSSFTNEGFLPSYERLEFLGDAVLELVVSEYLYYLPEEKNEGLLSKLKSYLVNENTLSEIAENLNIGNYLLMSIGEERSGGRNRPSILADVIESLIAALYIDQGYERAKEFVLRIIEPYIRKENETIIFQDYKSYLQELSQQKYTTIPEYVLVEEIGPEHEKVFLVKVNIKDKELGYGRGSSKKKAEQEAAKSALRQLGIIVS